jgi:hypothetical protein
MAFGLQQLLTAIRRPLLAGEERKPESRGYPWTVSHRMQTTPHWIKTTSFRIKAISREKESISREEESTSL